MFAPLAEEGVGGCGGRELVWGEVGGGWAGRESKVGRNLG